MYNKKIIIITNDNCKQQILKYVTKNKIFIDLKFYNLKTFKEEYFFRYSEKTIPYLINKYHLKINILENYLDKLYYIEDKDYHNKKLQFLKDLKQELITNNLIITNPYFLDYIKDYQIYVLGYSYLNNLERNLFTNIKAQIINDKNIYKHNKVYVFSKIEEEITFVCEQIINLLNNNISINNIKLMNVTSEYYNALWQISSMYHLPIKIPSNNNLYSHNITKNFLKNIILSKDYALKELQKEDNLEIVNMIINIYNKYLFLDDISILREILINEFKKTKINNNYYQNYIDIINLEDFISDDDYVFLMNFTTNSIPNFQKDEDYFTDNIKEELDLDKTNIINKYIKEYTINKIGSIKNLYISYKLKDNKMVNYPSILVNTLNLTKEEYQNNSLIHYSYTMDKLSLAKMHYNYETYGIIDHNYYLYMRNIPDLNYNSYLNDFKGIDKNSLKEYLNNKLYLSYSNLNNYHKCAFRYYLNNILKLNKKEDLFETFIGSLYHYVLSKCIDTSKEIEEETLEYLKTSNRDLSKKEEFFLNIIKEDISKSLNIIKEQQQNIKLDQILKEQYLKINKNKDWEINFVGFIDKILYKEFNNKTVIALIDYKTGKEEIDLKYKDYGFNLQLPFYLYLIKESKLFKNPIFAGFYLQFLLNKREEDNLKLEGYSNNDPSVIELLDNNYQNSNLIKGLKCKNNGEFYKSSKVLSNEEIDSLITLINNFIDEDINKIINASFEINPKRIGYQKDIGCKYCPYIDICYKKESDYVLLKEVEEDNYAGLD